MKDLVSGGKGRAATMAEGLRHMPLTWRRAKQLAQQKLLTLADFINLTGLAPDHNGQIGLFDVNEGGIRYALSAASLRGRSTKQQERASRLVEQGHLQLPCTPAALIAFSVHWEGELAIPRIFVEAVEQCGRDQAHEQAYDQWQDEFLAQLGQRGVADAKIDYAAFRSLTTFDSGQSPHTGGAGGDHLYAYRRDELGHVVAIEAGGFVLSAIESGEGQEAAEWQRRAHVAFPTTAGGLVQWIRGQGGDVELTFPGNPDWPTDPGKWADFVAAQSGVERTDTPPRPPAVSTGYKLTIQAHDDLHPIFIKLTAQVWKRRIDLVRRAEKMLIDACRDSGNGHETAFRLNETGNLEKRDGDGAFQPYSQDALRKAFTGWCKRNPDKFRTN
jgi:hypothetical protein